MRLVVHQRGGYDDGADGSTFNRSVDPVKAPAWGGRWDDYFRQQRHPIFWRLLKLIRR
jgi:hypothetical protein